MQKFYLFYMCSMPKARADCKRPCFDQSVTKTAAALRCVVSADQIQPLAKITFLIFNYRVSRKIKTAKFDCFNVSRTPCRKI